MTLAEFISGAENYWRLHPTQRRGQAYFNYLIRVDELTAEVIRGTAFDPFYDDEKVSSFLIRISGIFIG
jgi:hypothetical protein